MSNTKKLKLFKKCLQEAKKDNDEILINYYEKQIKLIKTVIFLNKNFL